MKKNASIAMTRLECPKRPGSGCLTIKMEVTMIAELKTKKNESKKQLSKTSLRNWNLTASS